LLKGQVNPEDKMSQTTAPAASPNALRVYLRDSRELLTSLVLIAPLFVIYQIGILTTGGIRNGVDFLTPLLYRDLLGGVTLYYVLFNLGVMAALGGLLVILRKKQRLHPKTFGLVFVESGVYALGLGALVQVILRHLGVTPDLSAGALEQLGPWGNFVLSLGAGLYEELVFRLLLLGGAVWSIGGALRWGAARASLGAEASLWGVMGRSFFPAPGQPELLDGPTRWLLKVGAVVVTSLIFSGVHYVGALGDEFTVYSFLFRFVAGVLFAGLFSVRGLAVAVYTHALYDVLVLVF
jgi:hypothetical protein